MSKEVKHEFLQAFKLLQNPWLKYKGNRKNFLSHPLVFKKLCRRLGYKQYIPFIDIVKSTKNLIIQEKIWEKMCTLDLGWEYECDLHEL
jgi:hypothetical protein